MLNASSRPNSPAWVAATAVVASLLVAASTGTASGAMVPNLQLIDQHGLHVEDRGLYGFGTSPDEIAAAAAATINDSDLDYGTVSRTTRRLH